VICGQADTQLVMEIIFAACRLRTSFLGIFYRSIIMHSLHPNLEVFSYIQIWVKKPSFYRRRKYMLQTLMKSLTTYAFSDGMESQGSNSLDALTVDQEN
jgi:TRAP-type uncharacterized transport system fused permease subunit